MTHDSGASKIDKCICSKFKLMVKEDWRTFACVCEYAFGVKQKHTHTHTVDRKRKLVPAPISLDTVTGTRRARLTRAHSTTCQKPIFPSVYSFRHSSWSHFLSFSCVREAELSKAQIKNTALIFRTSCSPIGYQWCHPVSYAIVNNLLESSVL